MVVEVVGVVVVMFELVVILAYIDGRVVVEKWLMTDNRTGE